MYVDGGSASSKVLKTCLHVQYGAHARESIKRNEQSTTRWLAGAAREYAYEYSKFRMLRFSFFNGMLEAIIQVQSYDSDAESRSYRMVNALPSNGESIEP